MAGRATSEPLSGKHGSIIVREGWPFIIPLVLLTVGSAAAGKIVGAIPLGILTLFVVWFFRNPERKMPAGEKTIISPADGKIIGIEQVAGGELLSKPSCKISIFMNIHNVHVNRIPYDGLVQAIRYRKGKFLVANLDKASELNERNTLLIHTAGGFDILVIQIAGLIARRIVCWVRESAVVHKGDRFGLIRFGSRVEICLPVEAAISVKVGDKVLAGKTKIGEMP
ncbi:MAG: phosphatidylserine decarboxylase family protein [Syntrophales bacterium]|jgi:phosphatidylserine decarboxylase